VDSIIDKLGATTMDDLKLVDKEIAEEAVADLKLIPRKKALEALMKAAAPATTASGVTPVTTTSTPPETVTNEAESVAAPKRVEECVAIAIDRSGSMGTGFDEQQAWCDDGNDNALKKTLDRRTRMDAVKQVFYAFRDRTETLGAGRHHLGLIQFDSEIEAILGLTPELNRFEAIVDDIEKRGSTAIYSAVLEGCAMLKPVFESSPGTDLRILVLTDGQNNAGVDPHTALTEVNKIGAVVDAIIVGDNPDENLRRIVTATEGSCFQIRSLSEGFELMESEAVVSLRARRGGVEKPVFVQRDMPEGGFQNIQVKNLTAGTKAGSCATSKAPTAKKVGLCGAVAAKSPPSTGTGVGAGSLKRLMKEVTEIAKGNSNAWMHSGEGCHLFPDVDNLYLMKALITGPEGSPFAGGTFVLDIVAPQDYPFKPPKVNFQTPVYHCNVSDSGQVCLDILHDQWSPALSIPKVVESVRLMLTNPDTDNALRQWIAELTIMHRKSGGKDTRYIDTAMAETKQHATKTVDEWKAEWGI